MHFAKLFIICFLVLILKAQAYPAYRRLLNTSRQGYKLKHNSVQYCKHNSKLKDLFESMKLSYTLELLFASICK